MGWAELVSHSEVLNFLKTFKDLIGDLIQLKNTMRSRKMSMDIFKRYSTIQNFYYILCHFGKFVSFFKESISCMLSNVLT